MTPASVELPVAIPAVVEFRVLVPIAAEAELQTAEPAALPAEAALLAAMTVVWAQGAMTVVWAQAAIPAAVGSVAASPDATRASPAFVRQPRAETPVPACFPLQASPPAPVDSAAAWFQPLAQVSSQELARAYPLPAALPVRDENPRPAAQAPSAHRLPAGFPPPFADAHGSRWQTVPCSASPFARSSAAPAAVRRAVHSEPPSAPVSVGNSIHHFRRYSSHACCC